MDAYCTNCGHPVNLRATSCGDCGREVGEDHRALAAKLPQPLNTQNRYASIALGLSVVGLLAGPLFWFLMPASFTAVVLGHMALKQMRQIPQPGSGRATAALVMGYLGVFVVSSTTMINFWITRVAFSF